MSVSRAFHASTVAADKILVMGGIDTSSYQGKVIDSVECYDPIENTWFCAAPMLQPRRSFEVGTVNDLVYILGGENASCPWIESIHRYSIRDDTWTNVNIHIL